MLVDKIISHSSSRVPDKNIRQIVLRLDNYFMQSNSSPLEQFLLPAQAVNKITSR